MTVSMRVMSAGDGYKYLLKSVAAGDGDRSLSTCLLYTSDAADERSSVDLGGRRIIKKKKIANESVT